MTSLQKAAWAAPFLSNVKFSPPPKFECPRKDWRVGMSLNL